MHVGRSISEQSLTAQAHSTCGGLPSALFLWLLEHSLGVRYAPTKGSMHPFCKQKYKCNKEYFKSFLHRTIYIECYHFQAGGTSFFCTFEDLLVVGRLSALPNTKNGFGN